MKGLMIVLFLALAAVTVRADIPAREFSTADCGAREGELATRAIAAADAAFALVVASSAAAAIAASFAAFALASAFAAAALIASLFAAFALVVASSDAATATSPSRRSTYVRVA